MENNKEMIIPSETPDGQKVTEIADGAFKGLDLTEVTLPDSLEKIGEEVFAENKLTEVVLPDTMKEVAENAFAANEQVVELITDSKDVYANLKENKFDGAVLVDKTPADKPEDKPAEKPEDDKSAETGDMANTLPMSVMMLVSLAAIAAVLMKKREVR